jgi:hypothetical protein
MCSLGRRPHEDAALELSKLEPVEDRQQLRKADPRAAAG